MPEPFQVLQHLGRQIVAVGLVAFLQMRRNFVLLHTAGIGARSMQERATGATGAIYAFFGQVLVVIAVVIVLLADHVDQACPSAAQADDLVTFAQRSNRDRADCRVQPRDVSAARENADDALLTTTNRHDELVSLFTDKCKRLV